MQQTETQMDSTAQEHSNVLVCSYCGKEYINNGENDFVCKECEVLVSRDLLLYKLEVIKTEVEETPGINKTIKKAINDMVNIITVLIKK